MPSDRYTLIGLRAADGGAQLLLTVEISQEEGKRCETLPVFSNRLSRLPQKGPLTEREWAFYSAEAAFCAALAAGMRALGAGGCSRRALVLKLRRKGIDAKAAAEAAAELAARGYLQEAESAVREAERDAAKLWGNSRILLDLRAKGYETEAVEAAAAYLAGEDAVARCARLIVRRKLCPANAEALPKIIAALTRYGYTRAEIGKALRLAAKSNECL